MLHENRSRAQSFGSDASLYHRTRPRYPDELIDHLVGDGTPTVLDVGCGTGIAAALLAARGCAVLGVEVDERMAAVAREQGLEVEVAPFERWDACGRTFDLVASGQAWHWIEPETGFPAAADALVAGGRIALFWNFAIPDEPAAGALRDIYGRMAPELQGPSMTLGGADSERQRVSGDLEDSGRFAAPVTHRWTWHHAYTTAEWIAQATTQSHHRSLDEDRRNALFSEVATMIDGLGGTIGVQYATRLVEAVRA